jgi:sulfur carrier protein
MTVSINGKQTEIAGEVTVGKLLEDSDVEMKEYVSVQLNDEILRREDFDARVVREGDTVEFLYYMGGGSTEGTAIDLC